MLNEGDKNTCKELAREIVAEVLKLHIVSCPHGRSLLKLTCISIGIAIGSGVIGGGTIAMILKAVNIL